MAETYWQRRQARADDRLARMESTVEGRVRDAYGRELRALEREIADLYERFGTDGVLRYRDMLQTMDPADRRLLIEECEEFARQHPELADMVEIRKGIWQLDRMEGLRTSARLHMARATADATEGLDDHFAEVAAVESNAVAEAMGYGRAFHTLDDAAMRLLVGTEWSDGLSYSESIWGSARKVAEYVNRDMTQALIRGDSYQRICRDMAKRFEGQSVSNVMRVVQTEGTHVARQAQASEMRAEGFEEYYLDPVGDDRTCDRCREAARESRRRPFRFDEAETGANFPPLHPRCRCMVNPAVEDWSEWLRRRREERREAPDGTGDEAIAKRFGGDLHKRSARLNTRADPAVEYYGSAEEDDPVRLAEIKEDLTRSGVRISVSPRERESIGYSPSTDGSPSSATIHVTEGMSLSAWEHEYRHFCIDRDNGFPGFAKSMFDLGYRRRSEEAAYGVEIELARKRGNNELVRRLEELLAEEVGRIGNS